MKKMDDVGDTRGSIWNNRVKKKHRNNKVQQCRQKLGT